MTHALDGLRVLIVEDEMMVALMVEDILADLGCIVVDVAGTLSRGLVLATDPEVGLDGAILDVNLGGDKVYPVAEALEARGVPFIFATGYGIAGIAESFSHVPAISKPYDANVLARTLATALHRAPGADG